MRLSFLLFVAAGVALATGAPDHEKKGADLRIDVDLKACKFFGARYGPAPSFLPKDWARLASGIAQFRRNAAFAGLKDEDYAKSRLGIVDSGLQIAHQPGAGGPKSPNVAESPEYDPMEHGTSVFSVAASPYGVEPKLRVKAFPVKITISDHPPAIGHKDLNRADVVNQLDRALDDDSVKIINASLVIRLEPGPVVEAMLEKARRKKKYLVFAAGNEHEVGVVWRKDYPKLTENPYLLFVGATSPLGAPSSFSNFGPGVDLYAPGSSVDAFGTSDPFSKHPSRASLVDGTSFAAPQVSGVVAKLLVRFPGLSPIALRQAMKLGAIYRGTKSPVPTLNAPHLVEVLALAEKCLAGAGDGAGQISACLEDADRRIQAAIEFPKKPAPKTPADCAAWQIYLDSLFDNYFLSKGASIYSRAIHEALRASGYENVAEHYFYAPSSRAGGDEKDVLARLDELPKLPRDLADEPPYAKRFFAHGWDKEISIRLAPKRLADLVAAGKTKEALEDFLADCRGHFLGSPDPLCKSLMRSLPPSLYAPLAERLVAEKGAFTDMSQALSSLFGEVPHEQAFLTKLLPKFVATCAANPLGCERFDWLARLAPLVSGQARRDLLEALRLLSVAPLPEKREHERRRFRDAYLSALAYAERPLTAEEEKASRAVTYGHSLRFSAIRHEAGQLSTKDIVKEVRAILASATTERNRFNYLSGPLVVLGARNGALADALAEIFLDEKLEEPLRVHLASIPEYHMGQFNPWIARMSPKTAGRFIERMVLALVPEDMRDFDSNLLAFLEVHSDHAAAGALLARIRGGPQKTKRLQSVRLSHLLASARTATTMTADVTAYLAETSGTMARKLSVLRPEVVLADAALVSQLMADGASYRYWLDRHAPGAAAPIAAWLAKQSRATLGKFLQSMEPEYRWRLLGLPSYLEEKGNVPAAAAGPLFEAGMDTLARWPKGKEAEVERVHKANFVGWLHSLAKRDGGAKALADRPAFAKVLADEVLSTGTLPSIGNNVVAPPAPVATLLRERLPAPDGKWDGKLPEWGWALLKYDVGSLDLTLRYLAATDGRPAVQRPVARAVHNLVYRYPHLYRELALRPDYADIVRRMRGNE